MPNQGSPWTVTTDQPGEDRLTGSTIAHRDGIDPLRRYWGMQWSHPDTGVIYVLTKNHVDSNRGNNANWREVGSSKVNVSGNTFLESLTDAADVYGVALVSRLGTLFRSAYIKWNESLRQLTIIGSQALWKATAGVTNGNMLIRALQNAVNAFRIEDEILGDYISVGVEGGKKVTRIFARKRLMNGEGFSENEFKTQLCEGTGDTLIKSFDLPDNSLLTIDVEGISTINTDGNTIIGDAQFSVKRVANVVTNISIDSLRYERQISTVKSPAGSVTNADTRFDITIVGNVVNLVFANSSNKETKGQAEVKFNISAMPGIL